MTTTGGDVLVETLLDWGVDTVFGLPGDGINGIMEALRTRQDKIRFVLTTALQPDHAIAAHVRLHGDGVRDIALTVDDAEAAYRATTERGARSVREPFTRSDDSGEVRMASIAAYGDTIHTFVERRNYRGTFLPGFVAVTASDQVSRPTGLKYIDHMVGNVGWNQMNVWVKFYEDVMGFRLYQTFDDKDISTEYSALMSKVLSNGNGRIKFPINEPAEGRKKSQIEEYLNFHRGPGVQHMALASDDIISSVRTLRARNIGFLKTPRSYYEMLEQRVGQIDPEIADLCELGILVDRDGWGYLMQVFTEPMQSRPTMFFELIQRYGARGFGGGNIKALFEAVEREQSRRGTFN